MNRHQTITYNLNLPIFATIIKYDCYFHGIVESTLIGHRDDITCMAILPNNKIVTGSKDATLRIWNTRTCEATLRGHSHEITCVLVLPDGTIVSGCQRGTLRIWRFNKCKAVLTGHTDMITCLAILSDDKIVSVSFDNTLKIWRTEDFTCEMTLKEHHGYTCMCTP